MVTQLGRTYVVKKAFSGGALILTEMDGKEFPDPINVDIVKKYYAWGHQKKDLSKLKTRKGGFDKNRKKEKRERFKVKTRKGSLNHKKWDEKWKEKRKWEVKLKTRKGGLITKRIPRLKTRKGDLGRRKLIKGIQGMESCDNQASLVCGKAEFDICSERTKDIGQGAHSG